MGSWNGTRGGNKTTKKGENSVWGGGLEKQYIMMLKSCTGKTRGGGRGVVGVTREGKGRGEGGRELESSLQNSAFPAREKWVFNFRKWKFFFEACY